MASSRREAEFQEARRIRAEMNKKENKAYEQKSQNLQSALKNFGLGDDSQNNSVVGTREELDKELRRRLREQSESRKQGRFELRKKQFERLLKSDEEKAERRKSRSERELRKETIKTLKQKQRVLEELQEKVKGFSTKLRKGFEDFGEVKKSKNGKNYIILQDGRALFVSKSQYKRLRSQSKIPKVKKIYNINQDIYNNPDNKAVQQLKEMDSYYNRDEYDRQRNTVPNDFALRLMLAKRKDLENKRRFGLSDNNNLMKAHLNLVDQKTNAVNFLDNEQDNILNTKNNNIMAKNPDSIDILNSDRPNVLENQSMRWGSISEMNPLNSPKLNFGNIDTRRTDRPPINILNSPQKLNFGFVSNQPQPKTNRKQKQVQNKPINFWS